jgi:MoaA/NifB/PqqE/SkfB family radical SAM enzyme
MKFNIPTLDIKLTNRCNYECEYCYGESDQQIDISIGTFLNALNLAKVIGVKYLEFCGGEPLLHSKFEKFTNLARQEGFNLILRTNGILIEEYADVISKNFEWVGVSLDGIEKVNDIMRKSKGKLTPKEKFIIPINNIRLLKKKNSRLKILFASLASAIYYQVLPLLTDYILKKKLPIDLWKIYLFRPKRQRASSNKDKFYLSEKKFESLRKTINIKKLQNELGIKTIFGSGSVNSGECLLVSPNGNLSVGSNKIAHINKQSISEIKSILSNLKEEKRIATNKKVTYLSG